MKTCDEPFLHRSLQEWHSTFTEQSGRSLSDADFFITSRDSPGQENGAQKSARNRIILILDNIRSPFNVGSIFRSSDSTLVEEIILCGYTPRPPHKKLLRTAMGAAEWVPWSFQEQATDTIRQLKDQNIPVVALETSKQSKSCFHFDFPYPVALLLGNEELGQTDQAITLADHLVEIPMMGRKNSLNVASAAAIVLFEILRQNSIV